MKKEFESYGDYFQENKNIQKQHLVDMMRGDEELGLYKEIVMKNIHILPTDKPSRLIYFDSKLEIMSLIPKKSDIVFQNIYITSDEKIEQKELCYCISNNCIVRFSNFGDNEKNYKKIILTTDQDLITEGVQAIDDTFLEWFVKNPSCESVEVELFPKFSNNLYGIIILQEKPKQEGYICPHTKLQCDDECCVSVENCHIISSMGILSEPKQETVQQFIEQHGITEQQLIDGYKQGLELIFEAAFKITKQEKLEDFLYQHWFDSPTLNDKNKEEFINGGFLGAKWQAKRGYSEEDIQHALNLYTDEAPASYIKRDLIKTLIRIKLIDG
jgi:hypothetical protein